MAHRPTRSRQSRRAARLDFAGLEIVGSLLTPDIVARLAAFEANDQTVEGYEIPPGLKLRDEIARYYRIGEALWSRFEASRGQSAAASERFVLDLMRQCFGFASLEPQSITRIGEREFPVRHAALGGRVPIVIAPAPAEGARRSGVDESLAQFGDSSRRRSATLLLQEYLNAREDAAWGLVSDGVTLRVMRDNISLTRPAWIEANLSKIFSEGLFPDFSGLWLLIHQSRFGQADAAISDCALERWRERGRTDGVAARDKLRQGVEAALLELGQGFIENPANGALRQSLTDGTLSGHAYFEQLLRVIYRLIFIFAAEDRGLLHPAGPSDQARRVYAEGYSLARLRERSMRRTALDRHADSWEGLKATFRALMRGQEQLGLPALGGLFAHGVVPDLENTRIENRRFLAAIWRLAWLRPEGQPLTRVNWRDMETEELGSVYESLLELTPRASADTRTFAFAEGDETHGNARKTSGSYYTPDALVKLLLDSTLEPVLDAAEARNTADPAAEILKLSIIDPACGSGHFLLGAARRAADRIARHRSPGAPSQAEFQHAMRQVVARCIYGVDRNPMAVELCKVALWIETVEPGKPLGFLDANLRCGDSLLGVFDLALLAEGVPDAAYKPLAGDDKPTARFYAARNRDERQGQGSLDFARGGGKLPTAAPLAQARAALRALPEETPEQIAEKRRRFEAAQTDRLNYAWGEAADLYITAFLLPKTGGAPALGQAPTVPTTGDVWRALADKQVHPPLVASAMEVSRDARAFHWPLEFPDVMARGGFDVVLGNPPWDTISPDAKEFFSPHDGQVRFMSPDDQKARIAELLTLPGLAEAWDAYCHRLYALASFFKESGRYKLFADGNLGKGDFNVYRMFTELALRATRPQGRAAQFVPENLYNGANAAAIRRFLFDECKLERLIAFENTKKVWFDIHSAAKFCLYVASPGGKTASFRAAFGVNSTEKAAALSAGLPIEMPVSLVEEFSPEAFAIAEVAHPSDISISRKLYARLPKFGAKLQGSATRVYMTEIHMGNDREDFEDDRDGVPLYEGRMVEAFDHRAKAYVSGRGRSAVWRELGFGS
ncbi:Eco57I restriction-modification methylase domain-containing protein, partial [Acidisoma sp. S159]|uniref:Eco57I restriction-modification methylase domain-containing protein n=1 Tax=Acidisoma sp. S159 TaxID=1747225 RepID=UPI00131CC04D